MAVAWQGDLKRTAGISVAVLLLLAPAVISFNYIFRFGVDVPYWDAWQFVPLLKEFFRGRLPLELLTEQTNEDRIALPRLLMLFLARLTHYDTAAEMYATWLMLCLIAAVYLLVHVRSFGSTLSSITTFIPVPWIVLTLRQYEIFLWGWQIVFSLVSLLLVATIFLIERSLVRPRSFVLAILTAVGCTFSLSSGLLVWPTGLVQLLLLVRRGMSPSRAKRAIGAWVFVGACCATLYFKGYHAPSGLPPFLWPFQDPRAFLLLLCALLGNPFSGRAVLAPAVGAVVLALLAGLLFVSVRGRVEWAKAPLAIPLIANSLLVALVLVIGRGGTGIADLTISRYVIVVVPVFVGAQMATLAIKDRGSRLIFELAVLFLAVVGIFGSFDGTYAAGRERREIMAAYRNALLNYRSLPDSDLTGLFIDPRLVRNGADTLRSYGLSVFRGTPEASADLR